MLSKPVIIEGTEDGPLSVRDIRSKSLAKSDELVAVRAGVAILS